MLEHKKVRGIALTLLVAAAVATLFVALGTQPNGIVNYYRDTLTPAGFTIWVSGLIVATLSPPILSITCWFASRRARRGWLLHFFLVPVTYAIVRGAIAIMLRAADEPDSDGLTGFATDPAAILMLLCPLTYFGALGFTRLRRRVAERSAITR